MIMIIVINIIGVAGKGIDGSMTCEFTSFSIIFQSYQDGERVSLKSCVQWNPFYS